MKNLILRIYDWLSARKWVAWTALALLLGLSALLVTRMHYQEDISAFLPSDPLGEKYQDVYMELGGQDRIAVFFRGDDRYELMDAMDAFGEAWAAADTLALVSDMQICVDNSQILEVFDFISSRWPYFMEEADYARADSLLASPEFIPSKLAEDKAALGTLSSVVTSRYMKTDPLGLCSPVLERMSRLNPTSGSDVEDGYIFAPDGSGVVFFSSPFGGSETGSNKQLCGIIDEVCASLKESFPEVEVSAVGGPIVAVGNADRIKKDSILAVALALLLICVVLYFSYRRFSDVLWIAVSILCGALFALGLIAIFKSTISIIVLGIGAMIIGIAVNYPLHYIDHLKYRPDKREALAEQVTPLLVGNITTVGAFLGLLLMKADALHDFGLVGALMLVGTILFVLIFLPVLAPGRAEEAHNTVRLDLDRNISLSRRGRRIVFVAFLVLTGAFAVLSRGVGFDADMHHINYMTEDQSRGFELLESMGQDASGRDLIYAVAEAPSAEEALELAESLSLVMDSALEGVSGGAVSSICRFLPSENVRRARVDRWVEFWASHTDALESLRREAARLGFSASAFEPFLAQAESSQWPTLTVEDFSPVARTLGASMFFEREEGTRVVSFVRAPQGAAAAVKSAQLPEGCFAFDSSDVSGRLASLLSEDFDRIGLICSLIVFFFLWLSFGSLELSLMSFLPLAVGWVWILGIMHLAGLQFNIVNIILATFIFGMGDDYTIFITEGLMYEYTTGRKILHSFKNSVALSALIMFIGIGVLVFARHPAMSSVGAVTVIGMLVVVVMAYYIPPLIFRWLTTKKGVRREVPVTIARLLRSAWALTFLALVVIFVTPVVCLRSLGPQSEASKLRYHKFLYRLSRFIVNHIPGCPYTLVNEVGEDFSRPAVYIANHQSHLDVMAVMALTPKLVVLTNDWVWNNHVYGALIHRAEFYPASEGYETLLPKLRDLVSRGYSILVYPEGTRSEDCSIGRFHRGAFTLARDLGVEVLPLYVHGFGHALPKNDFMLRPVGISLEVGRRRAVEGEDFKAITREFRAMYVEEYERISAARETDGYWAAVDRCRKIYLSK